MRTAEDVKRDPIEGDQVLTRACFVIPWLNASQWKHVWKQRETDLHAEVVRLREALKRIGKRTCVGNCDQGNTCSVCIARAALSGSPATEAVTSQRIHDRERESK